MFAKHEKTTIREKINSRSPKMSTSVIYNNITFRIGFEGRQFEKKTFGFCPTGFPKTSIASEPITK